MEGLDALQKRIKTTQDMRSIVSTMKSLSAVSIIQYDSALKSLLEYGKTIDSGVVVLMKNGVVSVPKIKTLPEKNRKVLAIVIGSDTGLVGKLNRDTVSFAKKTLKEQGFLEENTHYIAVGRQIIGQFERHETPIEAGYPISNSVKAIGTTAATLLVKIDKLMRKELLTHVYLFYPQKEGALVRSSESLIIPMGEEWLSSLKDKKWESKRFPIYKMPSDVLFSSLVQERLLMEVSTTLAQSLTAEHHMRLTTMQAAEKNIDENLEKMNQTYQQLRQENITTELLDVVNGAEALRGMRKKEEKKEQN